MLLGVSLSLLLMAPAAGQERVEAETFNPELSVAAGYDTNVEYLGSPNEGTSDEVAQLRAFLPYRVVRTRWDLLLSYRLSYNVYRNNNDFDYAGHHLNLGWTTDVGRFSRFGLWTRASRTQDQGDPYGQDETDLNLTQRTQRTFLRVGMTFDQQVGRRWKWGLGLNAGRATYQRVEGTTPPADAPPLEDRDSYKLEFRLDRILNPRNDLGGYVSGEYVEFELNPAQTLTRIGMEWNHRRTQALGFRSRLGVYSRRQDDIPGGESPTLNRSGIELGFVLDYEQLVGPAILTFEAFAEPSTGGLLPDGSTNIGVGVIATRANPRLQWDWSLASRYTYRIPSESTNPDIQTLSIDGRIERRFGRKVGLRLRARYVDQTDNGNGGVSGSYGIVGLRFVWYPIGGSRLAMGPS